MGMVAACSKLRWSGLGTTKSWPGRCELAETLRCKRDHRLTDMQPLHTLADGGDRAGALPAERAGFAGIEVHCVQDIAEVQPRGADPDLDLTRTRLTSDAGWSVSLSRRRRSTSRAGRAGYRSHRAYGSGRRPTPTPDQPVDVPMALAIGNLLIRPLAREQVVD